MEFIGYIHTKYPEKFGIPRQSGIVDSPGYIELIPPYSDPSAVRDLEGFEYIWLLWDCSKARGKWSPTVRPPKLGGNTRVSVFATRSPFHPNSIGLSCVRLLSITQKEGVAVLEISGADVIDGTPLYDIKPYLPYADSHPGAKAGWTDSIERKELTVNIACEIDENIVDVVTALVREDPRPGYQEDAREYGMSYDEYNIVFKVEESTATIIKCEKIL